MAATNHERVGKALELLRAGLAPFVDREMKRAVRNGRLDRSVLDSFNDPRLHQRPLVEWDAAALLKLMWDHWNSVFRDVLGPAERSFVGELRGHRNRWAHQEAFSGDDAYRALDTAGRLLTAVGATKEAAEVDQSKTELLRERYDQQTRNQRRRQATLSIKSTASLKPWRQVVTPHRDVASGGYQQAEFAADLWQASHGEGAEEYRDPAEFFRRTHLTESLRRMLAGAAQRLAGQGGDPVVQLQTNFGGGKTHSMLALYHLCSGAAFTELPGVEDLMRESGAPDLPAVRRVVLVGNRISPGNPVTKADGTVVRTLWGELAWQLGGAEAFARIAADDLNATNPGDVLRQLLVEFGPCLILIDEWVAYARQLHDQGDIPGGSFETQFTFAQALTESAKVAGNCLLVVSLPASDTASSQADDVEVGGQRGRQALNRLRNVIGRIESSWRPASAEEGFEIVRRRLFEPFADPEKFRDRDVVARAFADLYRDRSHEFPPDCRDADYEQRLKAAYPIHPEIFDRLYSDWSTLVTFQRTRGVLRLMAAVIHSLWQKGDSSPLILPASLSIDDPQVQFELTRYLPAPWVPVIEKDVDGPQSLPQQIESEVTNLGKYSACRRVARTVYLGSAPSAGSAQRGLEDRRIKLGCVLPGEPPRVFEDALRRLASRATHLYQDGSRYWYDTRPTVTKLAQDRAEQLRREPDQVSQAIDANLRAALRERAGFSRIHIAPQSGHDVPDERDVRLVVLGARHEHRQEPDSPAQAAAAAILDSRGASPRLYRNTLVFLAPDQTRLQDLEEAVRHRLAWESILAERESLDLSPHQVKQADTQLQAAAESVNVRLPETYRWLLVPVQDDPAAAVTWNAARLSGHADLAVRAANRLKSDDRLAAALSGTRLRMELDRIPLWRGNHVPLPQLVEDFAQYLYLQRLQNPSVLLRAVADGVGLLTWEQDAFAWADSFDETGGGAVASGSSSGAGGAAVDGADGRTSADGPAETSGRYPGLRAGQVISLTDPAAPGLLVKPDVARRQLEAESAPPPSAAGPAAAAGAATDQTGSGKTAAGAAAGAAAGQTPPQAPGPNRFDGAVSLDATRAGYEASRIADEVITHLASLVGSRVTVTLEIEAEFPDGPPDRPDGATDRPGGAPDHVVRTVTENCRTLKFRSHGFTRE